MTISADELHGQERAMIVALTADYRSVYHIDLDEDRAVCYRVDPELDNGRQEGDTFAFGEAMAAYANRYVAERYRQGFLDFVQPEAIRKAFEHESVIAHRYLIVRNGRESYEMLRMAGVRRIEDRTDHIVHAVGMGFTDVDRETREQMAQSQALGDALAQAEEASRAKTAFLSNMSHEIRTPMNAIIGLDSIALNEPDLPDKTREYLEKIGESANHLLSLINDILDMSRIESGRMELTNSEFSLPGLLGQVNTIIGGQCTEKGLAYDCHVVGTVADYYIGDSMKLRQVLINILGNAVKFTPVGGEVHMAVERVNHFDGKTALRFTISDTGIGMDQDYLPRIFDAFSQEDSSTTSRYGSTGLGLAITRSLVEMMNGKIEVRSEKGAGSTFDVTVTLSDSARETAELDDRLASVHDLRVLVIDDDEVACEHARLVLESVGIASECALSGQEAIEMVRLHHARRDPYQLILVDWKMPGMDGLETSREIRQIVGSESTIIFLTAYLWDDVRDEAVELGVDSFISKPLFAGSVLEEFQRAFSRRSAVAAQEGRQVSLEGRRVLLAEDMSVNAEIITLVLEMRGMDVTLAENGRLAVEAFSASGEGHYDAILMDMRMPEMDGLQATEAIRALDRADARTVPIIALTANAFDEDVQRSLQAGLDAHLSKPVDPETLYATLESLVRA